MELAAKFTPVQTVIHEVLEADDCRSYFTVPLKDRTGFAAGNPIADLGVPQETVISISSFKSVITQTFATLPHYDGHHKGWKATSVVAGFLEVKAAYCNCF